jgi:hypothetical protein
MPADWPAVPAIWAFRCPASCLGDLRGLTIDSHAIISGIHDDLLVEPACRAMHGLADACPLHSDRLCFWRTAIVQLKKSPDVPHGKWRLTSEHGVAITIPDMHRTLANLLHGSLFFPDYNEARVCHIGGHLVEMCGECVSCEIVSIALHVAYGHAVWATRSLTWRTARCHFALYVNRAPNAIECQRSGLPKGGDVMDLAKKISKTMSQRAGFSSTENKM